MRRMACTIAHSHTLAIALSVALVPLVPTTSKAASLFSAVNDFQMSNPNGVWSYGYSTSLGGPLTLFSMQTNDYFTGYSSPIQGFFAPLYLASCFDNGCPNILQNTSLTTYTLPGDWYHQPPDVLSMHPGDSGEFAVVSFTSPSTTRWHLYGEFTGLNSRGTTTDVHILVGGLPLVDGIVDGYPSPVSFDAEFDLVAGQTVAFAVGYGANRDFGSDSTGLRATLEEIPEPSTFVLMLAPMAFLLWRQKQ